MSDITERLESHAASWGGPAAVILREAANEIKRLTAALQACAADFDSGPCTVSEGYWLAANELQRRMDLAASALPTPPTKPIEGQG